VYLHQLPASAHSALVDQRLVARVEALCTRAAALGAKAAALSHEAAQLCAAAESTLRLLPDASGTYLRALPVDRRGPLSERQLEVAHLVAEGLSNRQIAERLVVTERTVETHLERIFARLEIQSRARLARWIAEREVLEYAVRAEPQVRASAGR
jgi:DNA-binding NarL/FixJ family response regulator